jgi:hypothetical protein
MAKRNRYWFPIPLERRTVKIEGNPNGKRNALPYLVCAVPNEDLGRYMNFSLDAKVHYAVEREIMGMWIPDEEFVKEELTPPKLNVDVLHALGKLDEGHIPFALEMLVSRLVTHQAIRDEVPSHILDNVGPSNLVQFAISHQGTCYEKASLIMGILAGKYESRVVGFPKWDKGIWAEACQRNPPIVIKNYNEVPLIYYGELLKLPGVEIVNGVITGPRESAQLQLDPKHPPDHGHYWVEARIGGEKREINTLPISIKSKKGYDELAYYHNKMKHTCPTCRIKGYQVRIPKVL